MIRNERVFAMAAYFLCSSLLLVLNKLTVEAVKAPALVLEVQVIFGASIVFFKLWLCGRGLVFNGGALRGFGYYTVGFVMGLFASMKMLLLMDVETAILFRCATPILVFTCEYLDPSTTNLSSAIPLIGVILGSILYHTNSSNDVSPSTISKYIWGGIYVLVITFNMVYGKKLIKKTNLSLDETVFYTNLSAALGVPVFVLLNREYTMVLPFLHQVLYETPNVIVISCIFGLGISYAGWWARQVLTATEFTVLGVACKIGTILAGMVFWKMPATYLGILGLLLSIVSASMYGNFRHLLAWGYKIKYFAYITINILALGTLYTMIAYSQQVHTGYIGAAIRGRSIANDFISSANSRRYFNRNFSYGLKAPVVWSNDFHISTIGNVKKLLAPEGIEFIDKSLSGHCHLTNTCAKNLKVLNHQNGISPSPTIRKQFFDAYKSDSQFQGVDIIMCFHPSAMCEIFMPFNKRLFVIATTRYEMGREEIKSWKTWNQNLKSIASDPKNVIAANNKYDAEYIKYFTGIDPIILPSFLPMEAFYNAKSTDILVAKMHSAGAGGIWKKLIEVSNHFKDMKSKYGHYSYAQLCENTAIVHFPYQLSIMSLFEQYAMGIPILVPSVSFLWKLHNEYDLVTERTWERVRTGKRPKGSLLPAEAKAPDPNDDRSRDAFIYWVKFGDFYQWPHIIQFDSWDHLRTEITKDNDQWKKISDDMKRTASIYLNRTLDKWYSII